MALFVGIAIAFVLVGAIGIHTRHGGLGGHVRFFVGLLALVSGLMMLYFAYLTTTDDFGR